MVLVPAGEFAMGDAHGTGYPDERPVHRVWVSGFYMSRTEVTQAMWDEVAGWAQTNGYTFEGFERCPRRKPAHPVCNVSWLDTIKWANARSEKEGRTPVYYLDAAQRAVYRRGLADLPVEGVRWSADGYRLPTEAEWEKAARGGLRGHQYPWPSGGPDFARFFDGSKANFWQSGDPFESDADCATSPAGYFNGHQSPAGMDMANGFGLHDLAGNVSEWCWDLYQDGWYGQPEATARDSRGPATGHGRVLRGGSWISNDKYCRVASRYVSEASYRCHCYGFRLVVGAPTSGGRPARRS
jgi:formylglycine-generating enzyme required for sulfatase activity